MRRLLGEAILLLAVLFPPTLFLSPTKDTLSFSALAFNYLAVGTPHIFLIVYLLRLQGEPLEKFGLGRVTTTTFIRALGLSLVALVLMSSLLLLIRLFPINQGNSLLRSLPYYPQHLSELALALPFCLVVGYREELFFRSYLNLRLQELGLKAKWACILSAFLFGLAHLTQGYLAGLAAFLLGLVFSYIFQTTKDLHSIALAHAFYNFLILAASLWFGHG